MQDSKKNIGNFYWPEINDIEAAKKAAHLGAGAGIFCAVATLLVIFVNESGILSESVLDIDSNALWDVLFISGFAYGTYIFSRVASVCGLLLYWVEQVHTISSTGHSSIFMTLFISVMLITGVRGCFAYHQFKNTPTPRSAGPRGPVPVPNLQPLRREYEPKSEPAPWPEDSADATSKSATSTKTKA